MRNEPCTCGCAHCPTVVWDAEVDLATPAAPWFLEWIRANGIDPSVAAAGVFRVVKVAPRRYLIQWQEVLRGEGFFPGTDVPRGLPHEWGAAQVVKRRRETPMITAHLPGKAVEVSA